jgi:S1-C subfamily serine protease
MPETEKDLTPIEPAPLKPERVRSRHNKLWAVLGTAMLCFAASFLGAWLFIGTGLVKLDASRTISDNSQTIVAQQGEVIADVFKKVSPSTVAITTESVRTTGRGNLQQVSEGAGSGVIISKDGYVLTNKHVVPEGTDKVTVITDDGKEYESVRVIGRDPSNDLAFLKIDGVDNLSAATIGDSNPVQPGQQVIAIGNALGIFRNSVSSGIISGTGRPLTAADEAGMNAEQLEDMFQTDAAINPGNSGGPLVNLKGEVIGINTAVSTEGQGLGFAIPINAAKAVINSVLTKGKLTKAYVGVRYVSITADIADELKLPVKEGALVRGSSTDPAVVPGGPAADAGIKSGDIITQVNSTKIVLGKGLASLLSQYSPGDKVELTLLRDGKEQKVSVTLAEYPQ